MTDVHQHLAPIAVVGAGAWGTALAILLARNGIPVKLYGRSAVKIALFNEQRQNQRYLPDITFPDNLTPTADLAFALQEVSDIVVSVPSQAFQATLQTIKQNLNSKQTPHLILTSKGLNPDSGEFLDACVNQVFGEAISFAVLSGPSFATEVARGLPTAVTLASHDQDYVWQLLPKFCNAHFRAYASSDVIGVELGGIVKNVLAIAAGIADGLQFGANARSALLTRGLAELMRLGEVLGAKRDTLMGLSGLGDLLLTATDNQSRNRRYGLLLAEGYSHEQALEKIGQVVEGARNARQIVELAQSKQVELPICEQIAAMLAGKTTPKQAVKDLMQRTLKAETF